jgi:predicted dehydrogenase
MRKPGTNGIRAAESIESGLNGFEPMARSAGLPVGVVGCGPWGANHVRVLREVHGVGDILVADLDQGRSERLARIYPRVTSVPHIDAMLDDVECVVVATPPSTHLELALQAIESNKHVLIEKPMTVSEIEARTLIDSAERRDLVLMVSHIFEFNPAVRHLRSLISAGDLGRVYYLDSARLNLGTYRHDVNVIWDLAPHDISITNYLLNTQPTSVQAWGASHAHPSLEDVAYLRLVYAPLGVTANIHVSWLDPCKIRKITVVGSERMAVYDDMAADERVRVYHKGVSASAGNGHGPNTFYRQGGVTSPYIHWEEPMLVQDTHFVRCVVTNERRPLVDGWKGLDVVRCLEAADISMHTGRVVEVPGDYAALSAAGTAKRDAG